MENILLFTSRRSPALRHRLLTGALFLFVLAFICTLVRELNTHAGSMLPMPDRFGPHSILILLLRYLQQHTTLLLAVWLVLALIKGGRLMLGLYTLQRLRRVNISKISLQWEERLKALAATMKITVPITLLQSAIAQAPLLMGYVKPVILIPIGLVNALTPQEVEAILLHELAHIARKDYLVNLYIRVIETFLFFIRLLSGFRTSSGPKWSIAAMTSSSGKPTILQVTCGHWSALKSTGWTCLARW
jgi:bla regulator protein BlaR1